MGGLGPNEPLIAINIQTRIEPFAAVDANGDGRISREEYEAKIKKTDFDAVDVDGSGDITHDEYKKAFSSADPLSGQSIHRDGYQAVSVLCISRENCSGAVSEFYEDHAGTRMITRLPLQPGECVHFRDLDVFHNVTAAKPIDPSKVMHRSVLVLAARLQDKCVHALMEEHYGKKGYTCIAGEGELEKLFNLLDHDSSGYVDQNEFSTGLKQLATNFEQLLEHSSIGSKKKLSRSEFIACMERLPIAAAAHLS